MVDRVSEPLDKRSDGMACGQPANRVREKSAVPTDSGLLDGQTHTRKTTSAVVSGEIAGQQAPTTR
jgi:hypothetical protein